MKNLRHKVKTIVILYITKIYHPLYIAIKFCECVELYYDTTQFS